MTPPLAQPLTLTSRPAWARRALLATSLSLVALGASGCKFTDKDLEGWAALEDKGAARLGGYVLDADRPVESRKRALDLMVEHQYFDHIISLFKQLPESDRPMILEESIKLAKRYSEIQATVKQQATSVDLIYYMMSFPWGEEALKKQPELLSWMATWSLAIIKAGRTAPSSVNPDRVLIAALLVGGDPILKLVEEQFEESVTDPKTVIALHNILFPLKDPKIEVMMANQLMKTARKLYPDELSPELINVMVKNGNRTLLKFLVEVAKDNQAPQASQELAIDKASSVLISLSKGDEAMKAETIELFKRVLSSKIASSSIIFFTLRQLWVLGGVEHLADALKAINPEFRVPVSGTYLRLDVEQFCDEYVSVQKDEARPILQNLIDELGSDAQYWPARLYAITCIHRLYPDDFPRFLKSKRRFKRYFKRDKTVVRAWRSDHNTTLGEVVQEQLNPLAQ
jgi:hypothetical protein